MTILTFPYVEQPHPLFGTVTRPVIQIELYSERFGEWLELQNVLADTGADVSVIPLPLGRILVNDVESGQPMRLGGVVSSTVQFHAYLHAVQIRLGHEVFDMPVAIAEVTAVPPIFGRRGALDRFVARFVSGEELIIEI